MPNPSKKEYTIPDHLGASLVSTLVASIPAGNKGDYLRSQLLTKYCDSLDKSGAKARRLAAIEKWLLTEARNRKSNQRIFLGDADFGFTTSESLIQLTAKYIKRILGPFRPHDLIYNLVVTPGASTSTKRSPLSSQWKLTDGQHITDDCYRWWLPLISGTILGNRGDNHTYVTVSGNSLFTVPKNSTIDRIACKEPDVNLFLQRGVGLMIRRQLKKAGIDLQDQSVNQRLAKEGSITGMLATVDLSSASDSICRQLVISLLPNDWSNVIFDTRSPTTEIDGLLHENEMISSMGNGYTFELESLIFFCLTRAICYLSGVRGKISVYGDDIIAPSQIVPRLKRVFHWFGFKTNPEKTFDRGPFRESCGKHYWLGYDVTPVYIRGPLRDMSDVIHLLNGIAHWSSREWGFIIDPEITAWWSKWSKIVPRRFKGGTDFSSRSQLVTDDKPLVSLAWTAKVKRTKLQSSAHKLWHLRRLSVVDAETSYYTDDKYFFREVEATIIGNDRLLHRLNISG